MYVTACPHCGRRIRVDRPAKGLRVKCQCGGIFEIGEAPKSDRTARRTNIADAEMPHRPVRRKSILLLILVIAGVLASMAGIFVLWYLASYPYIEIRDTEGKIVFSGRVPAEKEQEVRDEYTQKMIRKAEAKTTILRPAAANNEAGSAALQKPRTFTPQPVPKGDAKVEVIVEPKPIIEAHSPNGTIVGTARNRYDRPLVKVNLSVYIRLKNGRLMKTTTRLHYLPPGEIMHFSADYEGIDVEKIASLRAVASGAELAGANTVCWVVDPDICDRKNMKDGSVAISGRVKNSYRRAVDDIVIYCDFYGFDNVLASTEEGRLRRGTSLQPGKGEFFSVKYQPDLGPEMIEGFFVRAWGRKAGP